jgi:putative DNA-binding protein
MTAPAQLAALQQWLLATITDPAAISGATVCNRITASLQQSSAERLSVYQHAYFARLLDVLRELFPCTRFAAGDEAFDELATGYLLRHPPHNYTLSRLADELPAYLEGTRPRDGDWGLFLVELAQLEQAIDRIFDGPGPENLPTFKLPQNAGGDLRLQFAPGFELHSFAFPVSSFYSGWKAAHEPKWPQPQPQHVALLRRDYIVRRFELSAAQAAILTAIQGGASLGDSLAAAGPQIADADQVRDWFTHWAAVGFFAG